MTDICLLSAVLEDAKRADIGDARALDLDLIRVQKLVNTRGLSILMIDFPDACKRLDASLSRGYFDPKVLPNSFGKRSLDHSNWLFGSIFRRIFNEFGTLVDDPDINHIFFLRQLLLMYKKVDLPCPQLNVDKAVGEFFKIESEMREPSIEWHLDDVTWDRTLSFTDGYRDSDDLFSSRDLISRRALALLDIVADRITSCFPILDPRELLPGHGPGAVCDGRGDKYSFPTWPDKLGNVFEEDLYSSYSTHAFYLDNHSRSKMEPPARLIAVPKTLKAPRMIASEPTSHQFMQHGLLRWLRENSPEAIRLCFDPKDQRPSQREALRASFSGNSSTFDLSSASDRLSCWVIERALRRNPSLLDGLHACRTRTVKDCSSSTPGQIIRLKKYANQGSAVTFPLQSLIYAMCCITSVLFEEGKQPSHQNILGASRKVRIFGDDLIIPKSASSTLYFLLSHIGLKVNMAKTHIEGQFRESCGTDAFAGYDVSPTYISNLSIEESYESLSSWIDVCNNAYSNGLWALSSRMIEMIPNKLLSCIPISHWPHSGGPVLRTFQKLTYINAKGRWNNSLQRCEVKILTSKVRADTEDRIGSQGIYQYFIDRPDPEKNWKQGFLKRARIRKCMRWVAS